MSSPFFSRLAARGILLPCVLMAACAQAVGSPLPAPSPAPTAPPPVGASAPLASVPAPGSLAPLVDAVKGAVVNVEVQSHPHVAARGRMPAMPPGWAERFGFPEGMEGMPQQQAPVQQGLGSGFIIDPKGIVITNNHVVDGAEQVRVKLVDGRAFEAEVLGRDALTDVAVLRLKDAPDKLPYVALGDSDAMRVGDFVLAIGNPFGLASSVSSGILSARARDIHAGPYDDFLQTDAAINPGNSGGPLFNLKGEVIGMNTAIVREATGIGFAVPSNLIHSLAPQLEKSGVVRRGWLGLSAQDLTPELAKALNLDADKGAVIAGVNPGSPGAKAGLHDDDVITAVDGKPIGSAGALTRTVGQLTPDSKVTVHVLREGHPLDVVVTLGTRPSLKGEPQVTPRDDEEESAPAQKRLGLRLSDDPEGNGARVVAVEPGSPADHADLAPGTLLRQVGNHKIASAQEAVQALHAAKPGSTLLLRVQPPDSDVTLLRALSIPS